MTTSSVIIGVSLAGCRVSVEISTDNNIHVQYSLLRRLLADNTDRDSRHHHHHLATQSPTSVGSLQVYSLSLLFLVRRSLHGLLHPLSIGCFPAHLVFFVFVVLWFVNSLILSCYVRCTISWSVSSAC